MKQATLDNGLEIVAEVNDEALTAALGFFVKTGSRDETPELAGVSHFLEHMVFKGTPRRDALTVNRDLDRIGAKHNAQTSEEDTIYHITSLPEYMPAAFEILADIMRPSVREPDFETEKQVILEEIEMYQDNPVSVAFERAKEAHFGDHPLSHSVLGTRESVSALRIDQMRDYFSRRYGPSNIVLAVAGKADWTNVLECAQRFCGDWAGSPAHRVATKPRGQLSFHTLSRPDDLQETVVAVADAPTMESDDRYAAALLAAIFGDHSGSRLYWTLVDPGHADAAEASYQDFNMGGAYFTYLSSDPSVAQANLERLSKAARTLDQQGPTEAELMQARNKVMARVVMRNERPFSRLMSLGFHWTYRRSYVSIDEELERFSRVTLGDLKRVLAEYPLWPVTVAAVGPATELTRPA
jgi:predicted Zn-dependent peptidase